MKFLDLLGNLFGKKEAAQNVENTTEEVFTEADLMRCLALSKMKTVKIEAIPHENLPLTASKFIGTPYFPKTMEYPKDSQNQPMILLAQLNFAETPPLENYPIEGILQFFISANHDYFGSDMDSYDYFGKLTNKNEDVNYKIIYHSVIIENLSQVETPIFNFEETNLPIDTEHEIKFTLEDEYAPISDWRHRSYFSKAEYDILYNDDDLLDKYCNSITSLGHKIGGYANFTQEDPRSDEWGSDYILLFQMDSIGDHIMWGDVGVANFFITEKDLKNKDFSHVFYTWDCC